MIDGVEKHVYSSAIIDSGLADLCLGCPQVSQEFIQLVFQLRQLTLSQLKTLWQEASFKCRNDWSVFSVRRIVFYAPIHVFIRPLPWGCMCPPSCIIANKTYVTISAWIKHWFGAIYKASCQVHIGSNKGQSVWAGNQWIEKQMIKEKDRVLTFIFCRTWQYTFIIMDICLVSSYSGGNYS